jgi:hypothetical protein
LCGTGVNFIDRSASVHPIYAVTLRAKTYPDLFDPPLGGLDSLFLKRQINQASKKCGCYRAGANSPNHHCTQKLLFINGSLDVERTFADVAE